MKKIVFLLLSISIVFITTCGNHQPRVFYINSYHQGYGSSDAVMSGIKETLHDKATLTTFFMDTKRHTDTAFIQDKAQQAMDSIRSFRPDVIIASDDNAVKYVIAPNFKNGPIPVVFCGVNWTCEQYGLPTDHVTGMLEVLPLEKALTELKHIYPEADELAVLSENTTSERKNKSLLDSLYKDFGFEPSYHLVDTFEQWKEAFRSANKNNDLIFFVTNGAIRGWDKEEALSFINETISKPVFTADGFMMPYAVFGFTKVAKEQGVWAAKTALKIAGGTSPGDISVTKNKKAQLFLNKKLAQKIDFDPAQSSLNFTIVNQ